MVADWNHGNAHFLRGLMSAVAAAGHEVTGHQPRLGWSLRNQVRRHGIDAVVECARIYPEIGIRSYDPESAGLSEQLEPVIRNADVLVVHEWNDPRTVALLRTLACSGTVLLFHDTHHRARSKPAEIRRLESSAFDGALLFDDALRKLYRTRFGIRRAWTLHEAADMRRFRPLAREKRHDVVWVGNWGDGERSNELRAYWLEAATSLPERRFAAYGARYPKHVRRELEKCGIEFLGWTPSLQVPEVLSAGRSTLHIPRRAYVNTLPGIPTIRIFEALACGVPLVSSFWHDSGGLFRADDFLMVRSPDQMLSTLKRLLSDEDLRGRLAERGLETIRARHTCDHRAAQLLSIVAELGRAGGARTAPTTEDVCV